MRQRAHRTALFVIVSSTLVMPIGMVVTVFMVLPVPVALMVFPALWIAVIVWMAPKSSRVGRALVMPGNPQIAMSLRSPVALYLQILVSICNLRRRRSTLVVLGTLRFARRGLNFTFRDRPRPSLGSPQLTRSAVIVN